MNLFIFHFYFIYYINILTMSNNNTNNDNHSNNETDTNDTNNEGDNCPPLSPLTPTPKGATCPPLTPTPTASGIAPTSSKGGNLPPLNPDRKRNCGIEPLNNNSNDINQYRHQSDLILPSMYPNDTSLQVNSCPNLLVMEDGVLQLYNTNIPKVNDNPKTFFNMEDYSIYSQSLIDHGINCPVLFVQSINDSQDNKMLSLSTTISFSSSISSSSSTDPSKTLLK